uniref:No apical meristem-associated C-terminal domain-containing protein n=1 Tax=Brassica oleracea var. oleracea TaxID=109376 RepID=A0A0D3AQ09_BRAOL
MSGYRHLLYSQMPVDLESPEPFWLGSQVPDDSPSEIPPECPSQIPPECPSQVPDYYNASPQLVGQVPREVTSCMQRWSRINHEVSRFTGCYNQALREQRSGQNDDDVIKAAYDIFFTKYDTKFTLDHCWRELRHEQKWASTYIAKDGGKEKRRPVMDLDGPEENVVGEDEDRPVGVKAAKGASKKKKSGRDEELSKLQGVLELKEKLSRNKLLDRLLAKKEPLSEIETTLKMKLMSEML